MAQTDGKNSVRALLWAMTAFVVWMMLSQYIWPPPPRPATQPDTTRPADADAAGDAGTPASGPQRTSSAPAPGGGVLSVVAGEARDPLVLGSTADGKNSRFPMELTVWPRGAAVGDVRLSDHFESVRGKEPYRLLEPARIGDRSPLLSLATETLYLSPPGLEVDLSSVDWEVTPPTSAEERTRARLSVDVTGSGGQPLARVTKTFRLAEQPPETLRHDLQVELTVENLSGQPLEAIVTQRGPLGIRREDPRSDDRGLYTGVQGDRSIRAARHALDKAAKTVFTPSNDAEKLIWTALSDKYFTAIVTPVDAERNVAPKLIRETRGAKLTDDASRYDDVTFKMVSQPLQLAAAGSSTLRFDCYLGPKSPAAFKHKVPEYRDRNYYSQVEAFYQLGCCSFLTFTTLIELMMWLLGKFHALTTNYGVAIIILVVIVRTLLHPITKKGQVNMVRMQKRMATVAPKLEELKKRFGNDKLKLQQETMKVYSESGINPAGQMITMLPMFLQMPIWIALYTSLNINIDMRHEPFFLWIRDLTSPDALVPFGAAYNVPLLSWMIGPVSSFNLLPILLAIAFVIQQKLMPKPPKPEGEPTPAQVQQEQMQKMMPFMSVFFGLIMYNMPSGLTLYIMTSTVFGTLEQHRIRQHIKRDEAAGKFDAQPPTGPPTRRSGKLGFFERLQKMAEAAQKAQPKR